ncbi:hypothetical protein KI387_005708 [Taxus chinensis]|uniref:Uncharacterized protein n=1 Tax=Taxus chinensis TaxID=29808 RepID=A0AA38GRL0_TAXCH|nr:hypothetical protein KI387_005708 [Taxus chinensis]
MGLTATMIAVGCIHLSLLMLLAAATSCGAGDCSKHAAVFPTTEAANPKHNAPARKDVHYERSNSKENSMARKSKGLPYSTAMDLKKTMAATKSSSRPVNGGSDYRSHGDYDSYDPAPTLVKPPNKLIPN